MKPEIYRIMYLSTAHLTKEAGETMEEWCTLTNEYGGMVPVDRDGTTLPECVREGIAVAVQHNCAYLMYDRDVCPLTDMPTYDW